MNGVTSALQSPKMVTEYIDKWSKPGKPSSTASSTRVPSVKSTKQKPTTSKAPVNPIPPPEDILAKSINQLFVLDKQGHSRKPQLDKPTLGKKNPETKSMPTPLKCTTLTDVADLILKNICKNIIVMAGAGISTPSGIPDFRTPGSGMYDNLKKYKVPYPEAIFDIDYFAYNPQPFFALAKELYPGKYKPNYIHYFVRLLHEKGLLLRCYTQNIDGLERMAGIPPKKLVEAHGTLSAASCHLCYTSFPAKEAQVEPFANIVNAVRPNVPRLLINRDLVGPFNTKTRKSRDLAELGDLCDVTRKFVRALNWQEEMEDMMRSHML